MTPPLFPHTDHLIITTLKNGYVRIEETPNGDKIILHLRAIPTLIAALLQLTQS